MIRESALHTLPNLNKSPPGSICLAGSYVLVNDARASYNEAMTPALSVDTMIRHIPRSVKAHESSLCGRATGEQANYWLTNQADCSIIQILYALSCIYFRLMTDGSRAQVMAQNAA